MKQPYYELNDGNRLPAIGFGTYKSTNNGKEVLAEALRAGYRYFDTAYFYGNENEIGEVINNSNIKREEIYYSSKVWKENMSYDQTMRTVELCLKNLRTDYIDLYFIHWPKGTLDDNDWKKKVQGTWKAMEELKKQDVIKSLGLSNFLPHHIEVILSTAEILPAVVQLELHVGYLQNVAVEYCKKKGFQLQAWSPLGRQKVLTDPTVMQMAKKYMVTPAQFVLGFLHQMDIAVIPKASTYERMLENQKIFDFKISREDLYYLQCMPQMGWSGEHPDFERKLITN